MKPTMKDIKEAIELAAQMGRMSYAREAYGLVKLRMKNLN